MLVNAEVEENRVASEQAHVSAEQARVIAGTSPPGAPCYTMSGTDLGNVLPGAGALSVPRELVVVRVGSAICYAVPGPDRGCALRYLLCDVRYCRRILSPAISLRAR
eukprot:895563-Rhodomonas_salina.1